MRRTMAPTAPGKVWLTVNRERSLEDPPIARCTVERLRGELGLVGAVRGTVTRTTISDPKAPKPLDLVNRNFAPLAPDRLWVADLTYCSTWSGRCYTAFVIDAYARRIVGWSVASTMTSQLVVNAVEQAVWTRGREGKDLAGLIAHHDHGVQVQVSGLLRAARRRWDHALDRSCRLVV